MDLPFEHLNDLISKSEFTNYLSHYLKDGRLTNNDGNEFKEVIGRVGSSPSVISETLIVWIKLQIEPFLSLRTVDIDNSNENENENETGNSINTKLNDNGISSSYSNSNNSKVTDAMVSKPMESTNSSNKNSATHNNSKCKNNNNNISSTNKAKKRVTLTNLSVDPNPPMGIIGNISPMISGNTNTTTFFSTSTSTSGSVPISPGAFGSFDSPMNQPSAFVSYSSAASRTVRPSVAGSATTSSSDSLSQLSSSSFAITTPTTKTLKKSESQIQPKQAWPRQQQGQGLEQKQESSADMMRNELRNMNRDKGKSRSTPVVTGTEIVHLSTPGSTTTPTASTNANSSSISSNSNSSKAYRVSIVTNTEKNQTKISTPKKKVGSSQAKRLGEIYACLILYQYLSIASELPYIARIAALQLPSVESNMSIKVQITQPDKFQSILLNDQDMHTFVDTVASSLVSVLISMGRRVVLAFSNAPMLRTSKLCNTLKDAATELRDPKPTANGDSAFLGNFIRPFREEIDSRNEYRTTIEKQLYNEKEKFYDEFYNLFQHFQEINRSDLDGSKLREFWSRMRSSGHRIMGMRDCNIVWFAEMFKAMLLYFGVNAPSSYGSSSSISGVDATLNVVGHSAINSNSKYSKLEERIGPGGQGRGSGRFRPTHMRQGHSFNARALSHGDSNNYHGRNSGGNNVSGETSPILCVETAAQQFPGNQQFFYYFIVLLDSNRFCNNLDASLRAEIHRLSVGTSSSTPAVSPHGINNNKTGMMGNTGGHRGAPSISGIHSSVSGIGLGMNMNMNADPAITSTDSIPLRIVKLRILGRFLGLIRFLPFWSKMSSINTSNSEGKGSQLGGNTTSVPSSTSASASPFDIIIQESVVRRTALNSPLPLKEALQEGAAAGRLTLTVPWVVEALRMMVWDPVCTVMEGANNPYKDALVLLCAICKHNQFALNNRLSSNRLFVLIEIQMLLLSLPSAAIPRDRLVKQVLANSANTERERLRIRNRSGSKESATPVGEGDSSTGITLILGFDPSNNGGISSGLRYDDDDSAVGSLLSYVAPYADEAVKALTPKVRIVSAQEQQRRAQDKSLLKIKKQTSNGERGAVGVDATPKKRQTPNAISIDQVQLPVSGVWSSATMNTMVSHSYGYSGSSNNGSSGNLSDLGVGHGTPDPSRTRTSSKSFQTLSMLQLQHASESDSQHSANSVGSNFNQGRLLSPSYNSTSAYITGSNSSVNSSMNSVNSSVNNSMNSSIHDPNSTLGLGLSDRRLAVDQSFDSSSLSIVSACDVSSDADTGTDTSLNADIDSVLGTGDTTTGHDVSEGLQINVDIGSTNERDKDRNSDRHPGHGVSLSSPGASSRVHSQSQGSKISLNFIPKSPSKALALQTGGTSSPRISNTPPLSVSTSLTKLVGFSTGSPSPTQPTRSSASPSPSQIASFNSASAEKVGDTDSGFGANAFTSSSGVSYEVINRLHVSFWLQHPHMQQVASFTLDYLRGACNARLKDRVAEAVRSLWTRAADVRMELVLKPSHDVQADVTRLSVELDSCRAQILSETESDGKDILNQTIQENLTQAVSKLCSLHPTNERVTRLAVYLIQQQALSETPQLMDFLLEYAQRKLTDVCRISVQQYSKWRTMDEKLKDNARNNITSKSKESLESDKLDIGEKQIQKEKNRMKQDSEHRSAFQPPEAETVYHILSRAERLIKPWFDVTHLKAEDVLGDKEEHGKKKNEGLVNVACSSRMLLVLSTIDRDASDITLDNLRIKDEKISENLNEDHVVNTHANHVSAIELDAVGENARQLMNMKVLNTLSRASEAVLIMLQGMAQCHAHYHYTSHSATTSSIDTMMMQHTLQKTMGIVSALLHWTATAQCRLGCRSSNSSSSSEGASPIQSRSQAQAHSCILGRISIEMTKFLTIACPLLFYSEALLTQMPSSDFASTITTPSSVLLSMLHKSVLDTGAVIRCFAASFKSSTLNTLTSCRGLLGIKYCLYEPVLHFITRMVNECYDPVQISKLDFSLDSSPSSVVDKSNKIDDVDNNEKEEWYWDDPSARRSLRKVLGTELADLVSSLADGLKSEAKKCNATEYEKRRQ